MLLGQAAARGEDSDDEDEDFEEEEDEEDVDLDDEFEDEEDDDDEEMPATPKKKSPKRTPKKKTPAAAPPPPPAAADADESLLNKMKGVSVSSKQFDMNPQCQHKLDVFDHEFDQCCEVEFLTPILPDDYFQPDASNEGNMLDVCYKTPEMFADEERVLKAEQGVQGAEKFTYNDSEAQAHIKTCQAINNQFGKGGIFSEHPQQVELPFPCEERVVERECQAHANDLLDDELKDENELADPNDEGPEQYHNILVVLLRKLRTKRKTKGGFRKIA